MHQHDESFIKLCENARQHVEEISIKEVKSLMEQHLLPFFIDVREDHEWECSHIPHAMHLSRGIIERDITRLVPDPETPIILYCGGGFRSVLAAESLQKMGFKHIKSMAGGFRSWEEAHYPLIKLKAI